MKTMKLVSIFITHTNCIQFWDRKITKGANLDWSKCTKLAQMISSEIPLKIC